jgi:arylsulfatase
VDGKEVDRKSIEHGTPMIEYRYDPPFKFTGKINRLTFKLEPEPKAAPESKAELGPMSAPEPDPIEAPKQLAAPKRLPAKTR